MDTLITATQGEDGIMTATLIIDNNFLASVSQPFFGQQQQEQIFTVSTTFTTRDGVLLCSGQATVGAPALACPFDVAGTACLNVSCQTGIARKLDGNAIQAQFSVCPGATDTCGNLNVAFGTVTADTQAKTSTAAAVVHPSTATSISKLMVFSLTSTMSIAASSTSSTMPGGASIPGLSSSHLENKDGAAPTGPSPALITVSILLVALLAGGIAYYMYWKRFVVQEEVVQAENVSRAFDYVQEGRFKKGVDVESPVVVDALIPPSPPTGSRIATPAPPGSVSGNVSPTSTVGPVSAFNVPPQVPTQSYGFIYEGYRTSMESGAAGRPIAVAFSNPYGAGYQLPPQPLPPVTSTDDLIPNLPTGCTAYPGYYDVNGHYHFYL
ncbi:hypothetical protein BC830DRAFT_1081458 [Chytriomyces sp. MP71]|nr:hypothetical protein BC830DRAFT_1081458 [Chytriomyces sp. MP71]